MSCTWDKRPTTSRYQPLYKEMLFIFFSTASECEKEKREERKEREGKKEEERKRGEKKKGRREREKKNKENSKEL